MASSASGADGGGGGGRSSSPPAAAPRAVVDNLMDVRERAEMLRNILQGSPTPPGTPADASPGTCGELIDGMMSSISSALSALDNSGGGAGGQGQGRRRKKARAVVGSGPQRRSSTRRRSHSPFLKRVTTSTLDDGNSWRKYGQKHIQDSPNPRSYYRCTHKPDQGCRATRQVQASDDNPSEFLISYYGQHTCRDPSTIPLVIQDTAPPDCGTNLISFRSTMSGGASTSTHAVPPPHTYDPTTMFSRFVFGYSSSLPTQQQDYRCGSEEVHSSSSPASQLAAVVGSAGMNSSATVGSAPAEYRPGGVEYNDMPCGSGTGSFPSSPSSLGFMTGSFGSFGNAGDDDLFGFDP